MLSSFFNNIADYVLKSSPSNKRFTQCFLSICCKTYFECKREGNTNGIYTSTVHSDWVQDVVIWLLLIRRNTVTLYTLQYWMLKYLFLLFVHSSMQSKRIWNTYKWNKLLNINSFEFIIAMKTTELQYIFRKRDIVCFLKAVQKGTNWPRWSSGASGCIAGCAWRNTSCSMQWRTIRDRVGHRSSGVDTLNLRAHNNIYIYINL